MRAGRQPLRAADEPTLSFPYESKRTRASPRGIPPQYLHARSNTFSMLGSETSASVPPGASLPKSRTPSQQITQPSETKSTCLKAAGSEATLARKSRNWTTKWTATAETRRCPTTKLQCPITRPLGKSAGCDAHHSRRKPPECFLCSDRKRVGRLRSSRIPVDMFLPP